MTITAAAGAIAGSQTGHTARHVDKDSGWRVSWLGDRHLTQGQAEAAMTIADTSADLAPDDSRWAVVSVLAAGLGMTGGEAVQRIADATLPELSPGD